MSAIPTGILIPLARKLTQAGERIIVFRETKPETVSVARYLARELGHPSAGDAIAELPGGDPSSASGTLREALSGGVAFHNADLDRERSGGWLRNTSASRRVI